MRRATLILAVLVAAAFLLTGAAQAPASWKEAAYVNASNRHEGDQLGHAVALSADGITMAVGVPMDGGGKNETFSAGSVYVYTRTGNRWAQQAYLKSSNPDADDQFGFAVAMSADGNTLAVSAPFEDSSARGVNGNQRDNSIKNSGAVYLFTRSGSTWSQQAYVKASNTGELEEGDQFGYSVALSGDGNTVAVGAIGDDSSASGINGNQADNSMNGAGAVYVLTRNGSAWSQQAYVKSSMTRPAVMFGYSVALNRSGDTLAVGEFDADRGRGALYMFTRNAGIWSPDARLQSSNGESQDSLGCWVAISDDGNTVAAGALDEDSVLTGVQPGNRGAEDEATDMSAGAAYIFVRTGGSWSQQAFIKATNTGKEDWFGVRLALSGDGNTLAVGAPNEDSASKGVGSRQDDDSAFEAGAVYVYTRTGTTWSTQAYVKASNTMPYDEFGNSVALTRDGKLMVVGAHFQDSGAVDSGAVYVFLR
jgi:tartrate dehydratase beta subunit/fumarate hydratase class I family protein